MGFDTKYVDLANDSLFIDLQAYQANFDIGQLQDRKKTAKVDFTQNKIP